MIERVRWNEPAWLYANADHLSRYRFAAEFAQGKRILDAGTGTGYGAAILSQAGALNVVAVDLDSDVIKAARSDFPFGNLEFLVDDCEKLSTVSGTFDLICNFENIEHLNKPGTFLKIAQKLLSPTGKLLISTPDAAYMPKREDGSPANPFHVKEWTCKEFEDFLREYFDTVEVLVQTRTYGLLARQAAIDALRRHIQSVNVSLTALRKNWILRLLMRIQRAWGGLGLSDVVIAPYDVYPVGYPTESDFPIVKREISFLLGEPFCTVAVCSNRKAP